MTVLAPDGPDSHAVETGRERHPFGLKAVIVLLLLQICTGLLVIAALWYVNQNMFDGVAAVLSVPGTVLYELGVQSLLVISRLVVIVGLWRLRRWAWFMMMLLLAYSMATDVVSYFHGTAHYASMLLNVITVFYLNLHEVQTLFVSEEMPV